MAKGRLKTAQRKYLQHELLHGVYLTMHMLDAVFGGNAYDQISNKKIAKLADQVSLRLGQLYQEIGKLQ